MGAMRQTVLGILAACLLTLATACSVATKDPDYVPPPPLPPLEQIKQVPVTQPSELGSGEDVIAFVTEDRNIVCAMTSARGNHLNLPYEANNYGDSANGKLATVPVVHCELAVYPEPQTKDVADTCSGTRLGYRGGTVLLRPDTVTYGSCRSGVTEMEAEFGPKGTRTGPIAELPVLAEGQNIERNGLRCSTYNGGVACGNISAGVAFFVNRAGYMLVSDGGTVTSGKMPPA
ncbi:hypothetical protein BIU82_14970 [Arthrobacter sp. SW1]|uniref:hypothetical protein n=1 Tax=Arthrobacter sp. SW1 TaxID=1920889 RepID=UPI000877B416|nr:hypothetical protein [Arthrobacter sp. SW1]OFI39170.1 hypothetical protein BIU82_14970 [Arthrobacter sp. SW1]